MKNDDKFVQTAFLILESRLLRLKSLCAIQSKSMADILRELVDSYINNNSDILPEHLKKEKA